MTHRPIVYSDVYSETAQVYRVIQIKLNQLV